jgi:hypothetical protein
MDITGISANKVTEPGAYEWVDRHGVRHVGFVYRDGSHGLCSAFISEGGSTRAVSMHPEDGTGNGLFFGPLVLPR